MYVSVAIAGPLRQSFTYHVPERFQKTIQVGKRVMVSFGTRRVTGYVITLLSEPPDGIDPKDIHDVLDEKPLFDAATFRLFDWIARYYHEPLGEVIRAALPAGLTDTESRWVELTAEGLVRQQALLDALPPKDKTILSAVGSSGTALKTLTDAGVANLTQITMLRDAGLLTLTYRRQSSSPRPIYEDIAIYLGPGTSLPRSPKERAVLEAIRDSGKIPVRELNQRFRSVKPNLFRLVASGAIQVERRRTFRDVLFHETDEGVEKKETPSLTEAQKPVVERLLAAVAARTGRFLLHGITGSGKTEVYLRVIAETLQLGRGVIVLVPEIALTPQLVSRFRARFGDAIAVLHSGLTAGERFDQWEQIATGARRVVVGARSAIFAPVVDLGLVIVDEEHESSFKQEERPRYNARDLALVRGDMASCPVLLGSATPSLESLYNAQTGKLELLTMKHRAQRGSVLPEVEIIDLRSTTWVGAHRILSEPMSHALVETIRRGEQAILFVNRRGYSSFVLCRICGHIPECGNCSITLSYSRSSELLRCHYCGHAEPRPGVCMECGSSVTEPVGFGTEWVQDDVSALLGSSATVERMDKDTARGKNMFTLLEKFRRREIDVLVGTQMVAKGHDFPGVTLVGVLLADQSLKFPDFRASERTFQLLTQVAGRAGRAQLPGKVLIQSYHPQHYSLQAVLRQDVSAFVASELPARQLGDYPPFSYIALLKVTHTDPQITQQHAEQLAAWLRRLISDNQPQWNGIFFTGPALAPLQKIQGKTRFQILVKSRTRSLLHRALTALDQHVDTQRLHGVVAVDVDPVNLL
ncbi:MAG: primosomal protein N' [Myxococcales bacterium]|nr:primosomal protein N' [Myxococcales bacterium]